MTIHRVVSSAEDFARALPVRPEQLEDLQSFYVCLASGNAVMNLVGPSALGEFWERHALDSAQLLHVEHSAIRWADIGAGAGFPGIVLAILLKGRPGAKVHLVESMAKRARFLEAMVSQFDLPAEVHHVRAEALEPPAGVQIVTARACAPLVRLFGYTAPFFHQGARGLFLKGRAVEAELIEARRAWRFREELLPSLSDPSGRILRVESLTRAS